MGSPEKTLSMKVLEARGIPYRVYRFPEALHDAPGVAVHIGVPPETVYKTLVVLSVDPPSRKAALIMIRGDRSLDLKKVARGISAKKVRMAHHDEAEKLTGLKVGGISALALLDRGFPIFLDHEAGSLEEVIVSAGKRGINLSLRVGDLVAVTRASWIEAAGEAA
jgi:Cys-tRNA(Pro)/Cys-tRNA(Cys) deacylase